ncbi:MAG: cytosine deaminase, partial [Beijerinckiaceae bacterium]
MQGWPVSAMGRYVLRHAAWLDDTPGPHGEPVIHSGDIAIADGRFVSFGNAPDADWPAVDLRGGLVLPGFVDVHTHLDKGHIWARSPNPDGTFFGALMTAEQDREARWTADDLAKRMDFSLRCAEAHGTVAIRTHLDSIGKQTAISWPVFDEMRAQWKGRIALQAAALFPLDMVVNDPAQFRAIVDSVAQFGGVLGGVTYLGQPVTEATHAALDSLLQAAAAHGLDLDLHVDESDSADARTLEAVADAALRNRFTGKILCGHCCSLALMEAQDAARVIAKLAEARIAIVSLPLCNLYLQDRQSGRTPRWRGVAPLHELKAAGVDVM